MFCSRFMVFFTVMNFKFSSHEKDKKFLSFRGLERSFSPQDYLSICIFASSFMVSFLHLTL